MTIRISSLVTVGLAAVLTAGCSISNPFGDERDRAPAPAPLAAAPAGSVTETTLPPPPGATQDPNAPSGLAALDPATQAGAAAAPAASGIEVGRTDFLGSWTIASAGDSCQLSVALTTWTGGYRASTRGCTNAALTSVSAWNMEGNQVQLMNDSGATIARLYPASKTQFNGQTEGGGPISVSR
jgi:hypothetical protein